jgi:hypothetical protein
MRVYHLLSAEHALSDVALKRIRISRYGDLNDPFELFAANMGDRNVRRAMRGWKEEFHRSKGLLCFSRKWENPVLWSHYASKHRGMALGFDLDDALALAIEYSNQRLPVQFRDGDPANGLDEAYVARLIRTKFEHWRYEEEVRVVIQLDAATLEDGSYFLPFSDRLMLREVILGPLCAIPIDAVKGLVDDLYQSVLVRKARLAFKWFSVVPDERYEPKQPGAAA